jgi:hypothetical protein
MRNRMFRVLLACVWATALLPGVAPAGAQETATLTGTTFMDPSGFPATDARDHLVYEVRLDNPNDARVTLDRLEIVDEGGRVLKSLGPKAIGLVTFGLGPSGFFPTRVLEPQGFAVVLVDLRMRPDVAMPQTLAHRFEVTLDPNGSATTETVTIAETDVSTQELTVFGPPLSGKDLAVFGCCSRPFGHRLAMGIGEEITVAQRHAIDFVRMSRGLSTFSGNGRTNKSYYIFGDPVFSMAAGEVVAARDGVAENLPGESPSDPGPNGGGNFAEVDVGGGVHVVYAHLREGSVAVEVGDIVTRGQMLGRVGNTGSSSEPHLHIHVMDGPGGESGSDSDGLPYVFDSFQHQARITGLLGNRGQDRSPAPPPRTRDDQSPLIGDIISFPSL